MCLVEFGCGLIMVFLVICFGWVDVIYISVGFLVVVVLNWFAVLWA